MLGQIQGNFRGDVAQLADSADEHSRALAASDQQLKEYQAKADAQERELQTQLQAATRESDDLRRQLDESGQKQTTLLEEARRNEEHTAQM